MKQISFFARGLPKGQPRPRAFVFKGRARVYDAGTAEGWKSCVAEAARPFIGCAVNEPVSISCVFMLPRPKSHYGTGKNAGVLRPDAPGYHTGKPDLDNYEKAVWDTLVIIGLLHDDSLIVQNSSAKVYASGNRTGALIEIASADPLFPFKQAFKQAFRE